MEPLTVDGMKQPWNEAITKKELNLMVAIARTILSPDPDKGAYPASGGIIEFGDDVNNWKIAIAFLSDAGEPQLITNSFQGWADDINEYLNEHGMDALTKKMNQWNLQPQTKVRLNFLIEELLNKF